jgi:transposase
LQERATDLFVTAAERKAVNGPNVKDLHPKIGQLAMENDFLAGALGRIDDASAKR